MARRGPFVTLLHYDYVRYRYVWLSLSFPCLLSLTKFPASRSRHTQVSVSFPEKCLWCKRTHHKGGGRDVWKETYLSHFLFFLKLSSRTVASYRTSELQFLPVFSVSSPPLKSCVSCDFSSSSCRSFSDWHILDERRKILPQCRSDVKSRIHIVSCSAVSFT